MYLIACFYSMCVLFLNVANEEEDPVPKEKGEENKSM